MEAAQMSSFQHSHAVHKRPERVAEFTLLGASASQPRHSSVLRFSRIVILLPSESVITTLRTPPGNLSIAPVAIPR
jgi:hypothetical protein